MLLIVHKNHDARMMDAYRQSTSPLHPGTDIHMASKQSKSERLSTQNRKTKTKNTTTKWVYLQIEHALKFTRW